MKRKKSILSLVLVIMVLCSVFTGLIGCRKSNDTEKKFSSVDDFSAAAIGDSTTSVLGKRFKEKHKDVTINYYDDHASMCVALKKGDIQAVILDEPVAKNIAASYSDFAILPEKINTDTYGILFSDGNDMREPFNECIKKYSEDGTLDALYKKWIVGKPEDKVIDYDSYAVSEPSARTLRIGYDIAGFEPMAYTGENKQPLGYEIELLYMIGRDLNIKLEISTVSSASLFASVETGKVDGVVGSISITDEREEKFDFTNPDYYGGTVFLCRKDMLAVQNDPNNYLYYYDMGRVLYNLKRYSEAAVSFDSSNLDFVELSFLKENEQKEVEEIISETLHTPSLGQAQKLKAMSQEGNWNPDQVNDLLSSDKPNQREKLSFRHDEIDSYFPRSFTPRQKKELVIKLLANWQKKREQQR